MIRGLYERLIRTRWGVPAVLAAAVTVVTLNEAAFQSARSTLRGGITLTDTRIQAQLALQLITEAESAVRGHVLAPDASLAADYRQALAALPAARQRTFALIAESDPARQLDAPRVQALIDRRLEELAAVMTLAESGQRDAAARQLAGDGNADSRNVRAALHALLDEAARQQQLARVDLYATLGTSRWVVHLLALFVGLGVYGFMKQVRLSDERSRTERETLDQQVRDRTRELRELGAHLITTREDERARLARDLHDEMGSLLSAVKLDLARLRRTEGLPPAALQRAQEMDRRINDGVAFKRRVIENLRPSSLDHLGLMEALSLLCRENAEALGVPTHEALEPLVLQPELELAIYRTVQEALTNVRKHARPGEVHVLLHRDGERVVVEVEDDGQGAVLGAVGMGHHGLAGMRLRVEALAGTLQLQSAPGQGTRVRADLPYVPRAAPVVVADTEPQPLAG